MPIGLTFARATTMFDIVIVPAAEAREGFNRQIDELTDIAASQGYEDAQSIGTAAKALIDILITAGTLDLEPETPVNAGTEVTQ